MERRSAARGLAEEIERRRQLIVLLVVAASSAVAWGTWGLYGWVAVMLAFAVFLLWRSFALTMHWRPARPEAAPEWEPLVPVTDLLDQFEAELACQTLEAEGIRATYGGRAGPPGSVP